MKEIFLILLSFIALCYSHEDVSDNEKCQNQLNLFTKAFDSRESWALELFDTWAKIQAGYLTENVQNLGNYDHCVQFLHDTQTSGIIQGQHCFVQFEALPDSTLGEGRDGFDWREFANFLRNNRMRLTNGFCLPASCTPDEVVDYLNEQFLNKNDLIALRAQCRTGDPPPFRPVDIFATVIFSLFFIAIIASTSYDLFKRSKKQEGNKFWVSHSVYTNGMKLFDMKKSKSASAINCMNGLRVLSIFWIIFGHRVFNQAALFMGNPTDYRDFMLTNFSSSLIHLYHIAVDTFLVLGAILVTWGTLRDCEKGEMSIGRMIWRRYLRYTPALAALILFVVSLAKFFVNGQTRGVQRLSQACESSLWVAILHIQNYFHHSEMCLSHTWYLSLDFQLFIISPFIIYLMHKYGRKLLLLPAFLILVTIIYITAVSIIFEIEYVTLAISEEYLKWIYYPTQSRAGPWFMGIIFGYFMYQNRGKTLRINSFLNSALWTLAFSIQTAILFITFHLTTEEASQAVHTTFMAFQRNLWGLSICWIIFACHQLKTGGAIRWFLSLPHWQPIARMGLSMYIIHPVYQFISILNLRVPLFMDFWHMIPFYFADIIFAIVFATISYLAFEAPALIMEEYLYKKWKNKVRTRL